MMVDDEVKKESSCGEMPDEEIDETLAGSFPASDPPSWPLGIDDHCNGEQPKAKVEVTPPTCQQ